MKTKDFHNILQVRILDRFVLFNDINFSGSPSRGKYESQAAREHLPISELQ